jgi:hypothetical protein
MTLSFSTRTLFAARDAKPTERRGLFCLVEEFSINKIVEWYQSVFRIMAWNAISKKRKLPLIFIDSGVKTNQNYYIFSFYEETKSNIRIMDKIT